MWRRGADTGRWQSMIGQNMLECQLRRLGVYGADKTSSSHPNVDESFKFCEYGQRTLNGDSHGWVDGMLLHITILTNFRDGAKQSHLRSLQSFPLDFSFVLTGFLFVTMSLRQGLLSLALILFINVSRPRCGLSSICEGRANGQIFCNWPRLHKPWH
ncbi:hypothetical protein TorRG33x02_214990 [Trema orientale]|uniref:Uncharacterized protein n=1 Tax=Trema orientale TaxID=63057 RepID=A0A2P5EB01_TREOI|nr:hypothetical protein TorRG33x02_214990 [Trema orientale]